MMEICMRIIAAMRQIRGTRSSKAKSGADDLPKTLLAKGERPFAVSLTGVSESST
jgi:hypothetical protein